MHGFERELEANVKAMRRYAISLTRDVADADDLVQEALRRALDYGGNGSHVRDWRGYLFKILHNVRNDEMAKLARRGVPMHLDGVDDSELACAPTQHVRAECAEVRRAMATLSEDQRRILLLVGLQGFSYKEVAAVLEIPIGTVMSRLSRAREALRRALSQSGRARLRRVK